MKKHLLLLLFLTPILPSCLTTGGGAPQSVKPPETKPAASIVLQPSGADWSSMPEVLKAAKGKPVTVSGKTLDLKGCQLVGTKLKRYPEKQDERNQPLRINIEGFTLKNGSLRAIPGGVVLKADNVTLQNLVSIDTGEDAFSNVVDRAEGTTVKGCSVYGATDKSYQFNDARNLTFSGNYASGGITAVRLQKTDTKFKGIRTKELRNNRFENVDTGWDASGGVTASALGTDYVNVRTKWVTSNKAKFSEK